MTNPKGRQPTTINPTGREIHAHVAKALEAPSFKRGPVLLQWSAYSQLWESAGHWNSSNDAAASLRSIPEDGTRQYGYGLAPLPKMIGEHHRSPRDVFEAVAARDAEVLEINPGGWKGHWVRVDRGARVKSTEWYRVPMGWAPGMESIVPMPGMEARTVQGVAVRSFGPAGAWFTATLPTDQPPDVPVDANGRIWVDPLRYPAEEVDSTEDPHLLDELADLDRLHVAVHGQPGPAGRAAEAIALLTSEVQHLRSELRDVRATVLAMKDGAIR